MNMVSDRYYALPVDRRVAIENSAKRIYRAFNGNADRIEQFIWTIGVIVNIRRIDSPDIECCLDILFDLISE